MANAKKLPSGAFRCLVYVGMENGKRKYKSFTAPTKRKAEYAADRYLLLNKAQRELTIGQAADQYIELKKEVLSPATIRDYTITRESYLKSIENVMLADIDTPLVQKWVSGMAATLSPKSVRNHYGFLRAVVGYYDKAKRNSLVPSLPPPVKRKYTLPTDADIKALLDYFRGTYMEAVVYLAAIGTLRRAEICGLKRACFDGDYITVSTNIVRDASGNHVEKGTKTPNSNRRIRMPHAVVVRILELCPEDPMIPLKPDTLSLYFGRAVRKLKLRPIKLHGLRHYSASVMHYLGIPTQYAMERGGWANERTLQDIYNGALEDKKDAFADAISDYFGTVLK